MSRPRSTGRPPKPAPARTRARNVTLTDADVAALRRLGGGNLSAGIRAALAYYQTAQR